MDIGIAKKVFETYLDQFDRSDDKINLKIIHTYGVVSASEAIATDLKLSSEDFQLAQLIALLHDIGRFRQLQLYHSFDDATTVDHAILGVEILKGKNFLREFIKEDSFDELIFTALYNHNTFAIAEDVKGRALLHSKIIRDADKLDNYRVKEVETFETLFDISAEELAEESITPKIFKEFMQHHLIKKADRKTHLDMWLSYIAFMYDLNFEAALQFLVVHQSVEKLFDRVRISSPKVSAQWQLLKKSAINYLNKKS